MRRRIESFEPNLDYVVGKPARSLGKKTIVESRIAKFVAAFGASRGVYNGLERTHSWFQERFKR